jgi:hypothetical protein
MFRPSKEFLQSVGGGNRHEARKVRPNLIGKSNELIMNK